MDKGMMDAFQSMMGGEGGGMPGMPGVSDAEAKSMKAFFEAMTNGDPELKK